MSSSDEMPTNKKKKGGDKCDKQNYSIKPEKTTTKLDTSTWPLLLKVY